MKSYLKKYISHIIRLLFLFIILFLFRTESNATHLIGGSMTYECLGNDSYQITLTVYRDCSTLTPFDVNAPIAIFDDTGNKLRTQYIPRTSVTNVPIIINNPCLVSPPNVCVEKAIYTITTTLQVSTGGLDLIYQRCCRNSNAININNPRDMGSTYSIHIPDPNLANCNSSPTFNNPPPTIMCAGYEFNYDLSVTDVDGDSLHYDFANLVNGGTPSNPAPNPQIAPPYQNIAWSSGYSTNYQIDANPQFTINSGTGFLTGTPTSAGFYAFGIKVQEYRNGVFINEITRDFLLIVSNCQTNTIADFPAQTDLCIGKSLSFQNNSINSSLFFWDFGDPSTSSDTSQLTSPTYNYADTGTYNVMLIANPGYFCADTVYRKFSIKEAIIPSFTTPDDQCLLNNSFTFDATGNNPTDTIIWDFGKDAAPSSTNADKVQVSFSSAGPQPIKLTLKNHGCTKSYSDTISILRNPKAIFPPQNKFCDGLSVPFQNNSTNATNYIWNFGDGSAISGLNSLTSPTYTYPDSGSYTISLIASQKGICFDTSSNIFEVYPELVGNFVVPAAQCFPNNSFSLAAIGNFNNAAIINWSFGPQGNPTSSQGKQAQISFLNTGFHSINLSIQNYGCTSSFTDTLGVFPVPIPDLSLLVDSGCQPLSTSFSDQSFSWTPLSYNWNFGDGSTSSSANPTHTYTKPGTFDVALTIITDSGCIDTNTLLIKNLITVNPKPKANFTVSPITTYFLNHVIIAEDKSNVSYQEFHLGDGHVTTDQYIEYSYADTGHYLFKQYVTNKFNCMDTSIQEIWIKPDLLFFVPNTFSPNGDGQNDIFLPQIMGIMEYELSIFNRWGELFFTSNDLKVGWNGYYKNKPSPIDTYTWKIDIKTVDHLIYKKVGHINLIR